MFGWGKPHAVTRMVEEYLTHADTCLRLFREGFDLFLAQGLGDDFEAAVDRVHAAERVCDDHRRAIEAAMYEKMLIPESRADVLNLVEKLDRVPNKCEGIMFALLYQRMRLPEPLREDVRHMVQVNLGCWEALSKAVRMLFENPEAVKDLAAEVDHKESESDMLRLQLIQRLFTDEALPGDQRLLLRDLVRDISTLSDRCENASDLLSIIVVKRLI